MFCLHLGSFEFWHGMYLNDGVKCLRKTELHRLFYSIFNYSYDTEQNRQTGIHGSKL